VAVRAAVAALDPTRHQLISIANPAFGTRRPYITIVRALGAEPRHLKAGHGLREVSWILEPDCISLHWLRDTIYREDDSTARTGSGPHVMAATWLSELCTCSAAATSPKQPAGPPARWTAQSRSSS